MQKYVPLVKQKIEVYILGGQRIDHKGWWWRGLGDMWKGKRIEKGSRERIERESKETELTI